MKKSFLSFAAVVCAALFVCTADAGAQVVKLFNGKDLSNWNLFVDKGGASAQEVYTVKDGVIHVKGTPFGYMYTKEKYSNFILDVEWRYPVEATNSGIFLFVQDGENYEQTGYGSSGFPGGEEDQRIQRKACRRMEPC